MTVSANSSSNSLWKIFPQSLPQILPSQASLKELVERVFKNPFFWALNLMATGTMAIIFAAVSLPKLAVVGVSTLVFSILSISVAVQKKAFIKWLFCEISMMCNQIVSRISWITRRPWYSPLTHSLSLSACPLKKHIEELKAQGHGAVLSLVESFEVEPHLFGVPAKPEDWRAAGIQFLNLPNPDLTTVREEDVEIGVEFIHRNISLGRRVLVHCQAGVARSATIVICYLIKYRGMSPKEAVAFVKAERSVVVSEKSRAIRKFIAKMNRPSNSSSGVP